MEIKRVFVAGGQGMVGSAIVRRLARESGVEVLAPGRAELDLTRQSDVERWFERERPAQVYLAAAKVGGIHANATYPADFIRDNLAIQCNVIHAAWQSGVAKLCFLGSSCIYPKHAPQPLKEEYLLTGPLEPTNEWYAVAKIAGIKMCQAYRKQHGFDAICLMPTNLYGPGDNFHPENAHVLPAMMRRFHEATLRGDASVTIWGTGTPRREFLHVDDLAAAAVHLMDSYSDDEIVNVGVGQDLTILELAQAIAATVGFSGTINCDPSRPDGTPRKLLDVSRLKRLGWRASTNLEDGLRETFAWFRGHLADLRQG